MKCMRWMCLAMVLLATLGSWSAQASDGHKYGKELLKTYTLSGDELAKMQAFRPKPRDPRVSPLENALGGDTVDWLGPQIAVVTQGNPYTIVIRLKAHAVADGPASSVWLAGWAFADNSNQDKGTLLKPIGSMAETKAKAGQSLELVGSAGPVSFKTDHVVVPSISLSRVDNLEIDQVVVDVWTGMASSGFASIFLSLQWLWVGLVMLALWWFWFRR